MKLKCTKNKCLSADLSQMFIFDNKTLLGVAVLPLTHFWNNGSLKDERRTRIVSVHIMNNSFSRQ